MSKTKTISFLRNFKHLTAHITVPSILFQSPTPHFAQSIQAKSEIKKLRISFNLLDLINLDSSTLATIQIMEVGL